MDFFPHVYGHEKLKKMWEKLYESGKMPHTMILYGEKGLGKTTAALDMAGLLTGMEKEIWDSWKDIGRENIEKNPVMTFADQRVWYLAPAGWELKIEQFRKFLEAMPSFDEKSHVCIIDEAQTMKEPIANSLLKTLEEPIGNLYFLLITHDISAMLPTILSRGERFSFFPVSETEYKRLLREQPEKYRLPDGIDEDTAYQLSEGNPGKTAALCEQGRAGQPERAVKFWETLTYSTSPFADMHEDKWKDKDELLQMLGWILLVGEDLMMLGETRDRRLIRCVSVLPQEEAMAPVWGDGKAEEALCFLQKAQKAVSYYVNPNIIWDAVLIRLEHIRKGDRAWNRL